MIRNIQGLRGIAALLVFAIHLMSTHPSVSIGRPHLLFAWIGPVGVDIFFIISGFVVTLCAYKSSVDDNITEFIVKRLFRIYPLYWVVFIFSCAFGGYLYLSPEWLTKEPLWSLFFLIRETNYKVMSAWTLHWEVIFYISFSILLCLKPKDFWRACLVAFVVIFSMHLGRHFGLFYDNGVISSGFLLEFCFGGLVAWLYSKNKLIINHALTIFIIGLFGLAALLVLHAVYATQYWSAEWRVSFSIFSAIILYALVCFEQCGVVLFSKRIQWFGDISYSLYIWHQFIFASLFFIFGKYGLIPVGQFKLLAMLLVWAVIAISLSYISYIYIERPAIRLINDLFHRTHRMNAFKIIRRS